MGTGAIEGIAASEAGNNAAAAGAFAPLLALGIPGSGTGAVLLGGLMMWGLNPGPLLFDTNPEFCWSLISSMAGLGFNVIFDPLVGYFYKQYILGQPQEMASVLAKWSTATTFVNAVASTILVVILYNALLPALKKSGLKISSPAW